MEATAITSTKVSDIMTRDIYTVSLDQSINELNRLFAKYKIRHVPVIRDDKLIGIVSLTDIQRLSFGDSFGDYEKEVDSSIAEMLTISQVMKQKPVTVQPSDPILKVAEILTKAEFHALPVVEDEKLVGIITTTDIIRFLVEKVSDVKL